MPSSFGLFLAFMAAFCLAFSEAKPLGQDDVAESTEVSKRSFYEYPIWRRSDFIDLSNKMPSPPISAPVIRSGPPPVSLMVTTLSLLFGPIRTSFLRSASWPP